MSSIFMTNKTNEIGTKYLKDNEKNNLREINGNNEDSEFYQTLERLLDASSRTFAFTIAKLPKNLSTWIGAAYLGARIIDEIEDSRLAQADKGYLMGRVPIVLRGSAKDETASLEKMLEGIGKEKEEGYKDLLRNIGFVHSALSRFPAEVQEIIRKGYEEMSRGLSNPGIQSIATLRDHCKYCHYAAGSVGYMVTELTKEAGYFTDEQVKILMPNPSDWSLGINPAHDFGVALQLINDIRDLHKDVKEGIYRWPSDLLDAEGLFYNKLVAIGRDDKEELEKAYRILKTQLNDAKPYIVQAVKWIDELPYEPRGLRQCWGDALAMSAATWRVINTPEFFYDEDKRKIKTEEVFIIDTIMQRLADDKTSVLPFIEHLFERQAGDYDL